MKRKFADIFSFFEVFWFSEPSRCVSHSRNSSEICLSYKAYVISLNDVDVLREYFIESINLSNNSESFGKQSIVIKQKTVHLVVCMSISTLPFVR